MFSSILFLIKSAAAFDDCLDSQRREKPLLRSLGIYKSLVARAGTKTKTKNKKQKTKQNKNNAALSTERKSKLSLAHLDDERVAELLFTRVSPKCLRLAFQEANLFSMSLGLSPFFWVYVDQTSQQVNE